VYQQTREFHTIFKMPRHCDYFPTLIQCLNSEKFNSDFVKDGRFVAPNGKAQPSLMNLAADLRKSFPKVTDNAVYSRLRKLKNEEIALIANVDTVHGEQFQDHTVHSDEKVELTTEQWKSIGPVKSRDHSRWRFRPKPGWTDSLNNVISNMNIECTYNWTFISTHGIHASGECRQCSREIQVRHEEKDFKHFLYVKISIDGDTNVRHKAMQIRGNERKQVGAELQRKSAFVKHNELKVQRQETNGKPHHNL